MSAAAPPTSRGPTDAADPRVFHGIGVLCTMPGRAASAGVGDDVEARAAAEVGEIHDAALVSIDGRVAWVGPEADLPERWRPEAGAAVATDLGGRVVLPGLVECHTHLVYAGDRTRDFERRCLGLSYEEVARKGGGIRLTVQATRGASDEQLLEATRGRLDELLSHGVTTVEIKSGYGLDLAEELRLLRLARRLGDEGPQRICTTVLGAHVVPDAYATRRTDYVDMVTTELIPEAARAGLAEFADAFCEVGAFTVGECERVLSAGLDAGLGAKLHAEQLTATGATRMAVGLGAVSVDHLEVLPPLEAAHLAASNTTAVLLPGAAIFLGGGAVPPARALLDAGATVALSTDANPGSSPTRHLPLMTTLATAWMAMAPHEALLGVTRHAARALALEDGTGTLTVGAPCDLAVLDRPGWRHLAYGFGDRPVHATYVAGRCVHSACGAA